MCEFFVKGLFLFLSCVPWPPMTPGFRRCAYLLVSGPTCVLAARPTRGRAWGDELTGQAGYLVIPQSPGFGGTR
ncbi:hypothetical protein B0H21DRAFT_762420 [Amylocystis lapponica]|nr:hypothetical protein B0H21DRAFT_762420 [Amylocystis lapponica]